MNPVINHKDGKRLCSVCGSPDTVLYWECKAGRAAHQSFKSIYPNTRKCMDCDHVEWR